MPTRKLTQLALYTALSLAIFALESVIPPLAPIPGIKLGLANIITLVLLERYSPRDAFLVLLCRILLSALLFGQALSLLYSLAGGLAALLVQMCLRKRLGRRHLCLVGAFGGLFHNLGQLLAALLVTGTLGVLAYLPHLVLAGILAGLFTGLCASFLLQKLPPV